MSFSRIVFTALTALVLHLMSFAAASATEGKATTWVNVRSGPGTNYSVVDTMAKGEVGNITECRNNGWCYVQRTGPDGWVSSNYLTANESPSEPNCRFKLVMGPGGPRFALICGNDSGSVVVPVPVPGVGPRVCFYDGANYSGAHFCRGPGLYNTMPAGFNNKVSSIRVHSGGKTRICEHTNMGPFCRTVTGNVPALGSMLNNRASSFRVYTGYLPPLKQACLFDGANFTGAHLCYRAGTFTLPPAAFNKATSVRLYSGAKARLSKSPTYGIGGALPVNSSTPHLPPAWNNQTKSVRVY